MQGQQCGCSSEKTFRYHGVWHTEKAGTLVYSKVAALPGRPFSTVVSDTLEGRYSHVQ